MCKDCVKEEYPDRETMCLDSGCYVVNFLGCCDCKKKDTPVQHSRVEQDSNDGKETITFEHVCQNCDHVIAKHEFTFRIEEEFQVYEMHCLLCGRADDSRSIMPNDPRLQILF